MGILLLKLCIFSVLQSNRTNAVIPMKRDEGKLLLLVFFSTQTWNQMTQNDTTHSQTGIFQTPVWKQNDSFPTSLKSSLWRKKKEI